MNNNIVAVLDDFLEKTANVNKPYKALVNQSQYTEFQQSFTKVIKGQATWAVNNIGSILHLATPLEPLNDTQLNRVKDAFANMPGVADSITKDQIVEFLTYCFEWAAKAQYQRWGMTKMRKADPFTLTNPNYLKKLTDRANYLLNESSIDETTQNALIDMIKQGKIDTLTNDEIGQMISDKFDDISNYRGDMIARTETANAMGSGNLATMQENNVEQIEWVTAGGNPCPICQDNEDASPIDVGDSFPSGDDSEPAHPNCECYTQGVLVDPEDIDFDNIWEGA